MKWLDDFLRFLTKLKKEKPNIIVSGDYNICHKPIDINFPKKHVNYSGFLPEEREWMDKLVESGFVDSFRVFNQQPEQYSWWNYRANSRAKNLGWRIDYNMVSTPLKKSLKSATILKDVYHSDHCPVLVEIDI
jgi:exodeoxyribonuclease-3